VSDGRPRKQVILAAHFPGVNNTTVWADPAAGSQIDFASFEHLARVAERGCFDFFFLAEGLRLREQGGHIYDLDVVGRPDTMTVLSALAAVTTHLGLAGTLNATFHEPYELTRQLATLDHLSGGRAAWNVVTSSDAFTGANFRRGGYLDHADRYARADEVIRAAVRMWDSDGGEFEHPGAHVAIRGRFAVPRSPQRHPVILQAGDSEPGRELAAATADAIFSRHSRPEAARAFYADVKGRLPRYGRHPDELKIIPATTFALGDTPEEAAERARQIRRQQVSPQTAILLLEQVWNRDLSAYDPDGPLPEVEPDVTSPSIIQGRARMYSDPIATAADWRQRAEARHLSIRDLVIEVTGRQTFIGTPTQVADAVDDFVQSDAADGVILIPHLTPTGIDDFVDLVVPLLQERGAVRTGYETRTLREHLGLPPTNPAGRDRARSARA